MENILPCHPKDLPKLKDKTVLTLPIIISVAVPAQKINFWQSSVALWLMVSLFISLSLVIWLIKSLPMLAFLGFFPLAMVLIPLGGSVIQIWKSSLNPKSNQILMPNFLLEPKIKWKMKEIMQIDNNKIQLTDYFLENPKLLNFSEIEKFIVEEYSRYHPYTGFSVEYMDRRHNHFSTMPYRIHNRYMLLGSKQVRLRELLNLMNTAKKINSNEITFLSMDNYDNLMDIGM